MEDRFPRSDHEDNPTDDEKDSTTRANRGGADVLRRNPGGDALFRRIFETGIKSKETSEDDEEDDDEIAEKKASIFKRFQKPFKKVFRRGIIPPPEHIAGDNGAFVQPAEVESEHVVPAHNFTEWLRKMSTSIDVDDASPPKPEAPDTKRGLSVSAVLDRMSSRLAEDDAPSEELATELDSRPDIVKQSESSNVMPEVSNRSIPESVQQILERQSGSTDPLNAVEQSDTGAVPSVVHTQETYVNQTGWGPALVVDQLSRHRDRKIKRVDKIQSKNITGIGEQQKEHTDQIERASGDINLLRRKVDAIEYETTKARNTTETTRSEQTIEQLSSPVTLPDKFVASTPEKHYAHSEKLIETSPNVDLKTTPETVLKTVEKAAETSVPIESLYERRHELKGSEDFAASADAAIKSTPHAKGTMQGVHDMGLPHVELSAQDTPSTINHPISPTKDLYRQAAKGGAAAAVAVLIAFLVIYIVSR